MKVPISGPFEITEPMKDNINTVLESGRLSPGPMVKEFEKRFADYNYSQYGIMTNSGTSSLVIALQALKEIENWPDGSEVICPAITFVATINAVLHCNLKPVLVDVNSIHYTIDTDLIEQAITAKTVAIMPVHVFGLMADMLTIEKIASVYNLKVIEDCCESLGAMCNGGIAGSIGNIGCYSFYMSHHITAGVGGMAVTSNPWYAGKMRSLANHGWDRKTQPMDMQDFDFEEIRNRYHFTSIGHSFRATELEAAIASPQLDGIESQIDKRIENAKRLTNGLSQFNGKLQLPRGAYNLKHSLMMYPIIFKHGDKWDLINYLEKNGIETREMLPLTNQPCYDGLFDENDYVIAKWINEQGFYIGCSQYMTNEQIDYVVGKFGEYWK